MQTAMKIEFGTPDRVEWHLDNWARWMRSGSLIEGVPNHAHGGVGRTFGSQDLDAMAEAEDRRCARIVDSIVDGLPPVQGAAVAHFYLAAVFRFWRTDPEAELAKAKAKVARELSARGVW